MSNSITVEPEFVKYLGELTYEDKSIHNLRKLSLIDKYNKLTANHQEVFTNTVKCNTYELLQNKLPKEDYLDIAGLFEDTHVRDNYHLLSFILSTLLSLEH